jgi:molybdate transport repressor ModE-like protein
MLNLKISARWKREDGESVELDQRMLTTLKTIDAVGSISLACKTLGVSYRTLWSQIQQYNQLLGEELIATHGRAGACLTRFGHKLIWMVEQGNVRVAPDLGTVGEQLNAEWLDVDHNKPWISMALSDDMVLQNLFQNTKTCRCPCAGQAALPRCLHCIAAKCAWRVATSHWVWRNIPMSTRSCGAGYAAPTCQSSNCSNVKSAG